MERDHFEKLRCAAWERGAADRLRGLTREHNPYKLVYATDEYEYWERGYNDAKEDQLRGYYTRSLKA